ncbi:DNA polymerase III subunit gamma/tau [Paenisporosarcina cavernae]|uniref:DNA-directed DNA polymerase n=1 Tax=Paenisporosarcina cavernae TaxID=2320858 RepID=A0A385YPU0_9BACL|nr:DNA polymerase III subunit gamma/tau [Paenisporosarcina cavernae]AYC28360.1 DNA polymerase III subunit gamma/tau [Paenisporosarcina cavernae]AYC30723.1 DNA polymerase III subunit gamma/tau [Paenisporosarcina cavernae]
MAYQAFYRVYRPQTFEEMSGQVHVKQTLQNALLYQKTTHAYLFSGPRGTGKTSAAKIFAKALNCENRQGAEPCNECSSCVGIMDGSNTDVIEFDAASNSRVEEIRDIIERVHYAPSSSKYKVYIIDEVHMLSNSAFNALLKTLEEPPAHVIFILATTEPHKLPLTIISRCQRFDFKRISSAEIVDRMKTILMDSDIPYDETVLKVVAQAASGGMRDALSMLDQVVSFSSGQMSMEDALLVTGSIGQEVFFDISEALLQKEIGNVLTLVDQLVRDGKDPVRLTEDFITFFRDLLVIKTAPSLDELLELATAEEKFQQLAESFPAETLYSYIEILSHASQEMRYSNHAKVYLETAMLKMSQTASMESGKTTAVEVQPFLEKIQQLEKKFNLLEEQVRKGVPTGTVATPAASKPRQSRGNSRTKFNVPTGRIIEVLKTATKDDIQVVKSSWAHLLQSMPKSHSALLHEAEPVAASPTSFVLKFTYDIHCQMAADNQSFTSSFGELSQQHLGKVYDVLFVPEEEWLKIREEFIRSKGKLSVNDLPSETEQAAEQLMDFLHEQEKEEDPLVTEAEKLFGKDFVEVHDD